MLATFGISMESYSKWEYIATDVHTGKTGKSDYVKGKQGGSTVVFAPVYGKEELVKGYEVNYEQNQHVLDSVIIGGKAIANVEKHIGTEKVKNGEQIVVIGYGSIVDDNPYYIFGN